MGGWVDGWMGGWAWVKCYYSPVSKGSRKVTKNSTLLTHVEFKVQTKLGFFLENTLPL